MSTQKAISGNIQKNNGATVLKAGNYTSGNVTNSLTVQNNAADRYAYGSRPFQPTEVSSSGNIGARPAIYGRPFADMEAGEYVAMVIGAKIAQTADTTLRSPSSDFGTRQAIHRHQGYQQLDITSWDYETGVATTGANAGSTVLPSGVDGEVGPQVDQAANPTDAIPGELVYKTGAANPTQDDYKQRTSV